MSRYPIVTLLIVTLAVPAAAIAGKKGHYTIDQTIYASEAMTLQDRRMASNNAMLLIDGETVDKNLIALQLAVSLTRGSVDEEAHGTWEATLVQRRDLLLQEVTSGMLHWLDLLARSREKFMEALPRAVQDIETRDIGVVELCEAAPCSGPNMSRRVAMSLDDDTVLEGQLDKIAKESWPAITMYRSKKAEALPVGKDAAKGTAGINLAHVSPVTLVAAVPEVALALAAADRSTEGRPDARDEARQKIGVELWAAIDRARKKGRKDGWSDVRVCVNPAGWGGCGRANVTEAVVEVLVDDKKLIEAMAALTSEFGG